MDERKKFLYRGKEVDVTWDGRLCIHMAECTRARGDLFEGGRQPWCRPDLAPMAQVVEVVERCPSGALTYAGKGRALEERAADENTVAVVYKGPYLIRGDLELEGAPTDMEGIAFRVALCRCGRSRAKPFCDDTHAATGFDDAGAVGERGTPLAETGGRLKIRPLPDGPLLFSGNMTLKNGSGRVAWSGTQVALCRCGASRNKPFCDGSHTAAGFTDRD